MHYLLDPFSCTTSNHVDRDGKIFKSTLTCKSCILMPAAMDTRSFSSDRRGLSSSRTCFTAIRCVCMIKTMGRITNKYHENKSDTAKDCSWITKLIKHHKIAQSTSLDPESKTQNTHTLGTYRSEASRR